MPRKDAAEARGIQPGDMGIWATCAMKKEGKSVAELKDLFQDVRGWGLSHIIIHALHFLRMLT